MTSLDNCKTCFSKQFSPPCSLHVDCVRCEGALRRYAPLNCSLCRDLLNQRDAKAVAYLQHLYVISRSKLRSWNVTAEEANKFFLSDEHKREAFAVAPYPRGQLFSCIYHRLAFLLLLCKVCTFYYISFFAGNGIEDAFFDSAHSWIRASKKSLTQASRDCTSSSKSRRSLSPLGTDQEEYEALLPHQPLPTPSSAAPAKKESSRPGMDVSMMMQSLLQALQQ